MTKPAGTLTDAALSVGRLACTAGAVRVRLYVEYDVVRAGRIGRHAFNALGNQRAHQADEEATKRTV